MGRHGELARDALLNSAEELFARHGIDAVSNRQIAEHAGTANHSAIAYHFGNRDKLLHALLLRYEDRMRHRQRELESELASTPSIHDLVRCRLLPFTELLEALPQPSWRAQFLVQMRATPSAAAAVKQLASQTGARSGFEAMSALAGDIPESITAARSAIVAHLVLGVCADYEARVNSGTSNSRWADVALFLIDTTAGMLSAPVTGTYSITPLNEISDLI